MTGCMEASQQDHIRVKNGYLRYFGMLDCLPMLPWISPNIHTKNGGYTPPYQETAGNPKHDFKY